MRNILTFEAHSSQNIQDQAIRNAVAQLAAEPESVELPFSDEEYYVTCENMMDWHGFQRHGDGSTFSMTLNNEHESFTEMVSHPDYLRLVRAVQQSISSGRKGRKLRLVDMGCGLGQFVYYCGKMGLDAEGIEFQEHLKSAHQEMGVKVSYGDFYSVAQGPLSKADIVYLYRPVNKTASVSKLLQMIHRATKPGAVVVYVQLDMDADLRGWEVVPFREEAEGYETCVLLKMDQGS
jgi:SAM-dependent methyltransferase